METSAGIVQDLQAAFPAATVAADPAVEIALVDLSSIAYPIWHMSASQPDPNYASREIVARVRKLTANHPKAAICCDGGKSFRAELDPSYKANRPEKEAPLFHQIDLAIEQLAADGYPIWKVKGFEADDLIATATRVALELADTSVLIMSSDKDLLQLVGPRVRAMSTGTGTVLGAEAVKARFGVRPDQIRDYLMLVGDASDNVKGAPGIGPKKAADLLNTYQTIEGVYQALSQHGTRFKPAMASALREFEPRLEQVRQLITLRTDAPIPFAELDQDRTVPEMEAEAMAEAVTGEVVEAPKAAPAHNGNGNSQHGPETAATERAKAAPVNGNGSGIAAERIEPSTGALVAVPFERELEPRSLGQASTLAQHMYNARMFSGYGSPQAVLSTVLAGRELGMQAIASLRAFHVIDGKHALAADAMRGLVLRSGVAEYFRVIERTAEVCTFETKRKGEPEPVRLTYTIAEGRAAFGFYEGMPEKAAAELAAKWARSGWGRHPADMLAARASSKLARLVYADILFGLYAPEELTD